MSWTIDHYILQKKAFKTFEKKFFSWFSEKVLKKLSLM